MKVKKGKRLAVQRKKQFHAATKHSRKPKKAPQYATENEKVVTPPQVHTSRPHKRRRRRRRGRQTLNYIFFSIIGLAVLTVLSYTIFFKVYKITALGDLSRYSAQEVIKASGIEYKQSLFNVDEKEVYTSIVSQLPYVSTVEVKKKFPTTVEISVKLAQPAGAIAVEGKYLYIDSTGRILENDMVGYDSNYPLLLGITPTTTEVGNYVLSQTAEQITMLQSLLHYLEVNELQNITLISVGDRLNMRMIYENRILVELGTEADLDYKLKFVKSTIENNLAPSDMGVLDVSLVEKLSRGFFRDERNLAALLEEEEQQAAAPDSAQTPNGEKSGGSGIKVDPETGAIIVGPRDPLNPEASSSSSGNVSSQSSSSTAGNMPQIFSSSQAEGKEETSIPSSSSLSSSDASSSSSSQPVASLPQEIFGRPSGSSKAEESSSSKEEVNSSLSEPEPSSSQGSDTASSSGEEAPTHSSKTLFSI